jgi:hypothetical protein
MVLSKLARTVAFLTCILKIPGSNPGQDTSYPDRGSQWYSTVHSGEGWDSTLKHNTTALFHILFNTLFINNANI